MITQVIKRLPKASETVCIVRSEHVKEFAIDEVIQKACPEARIIQLSETTDGQATTCLLGLEGVPDDEAVFISACDNSFLFDEAAFAALQAQPDVDCIVWTFTKDELLTANPTAWGWVKLAEDEQTITDMSVKVPVSENPFNDHAVVATFWFRRASDFRAAYAKMVEDDYRINTEFYVDSMPIFMKKIGKKSVIFPVDLYVSWGKPEDLHLYDRHEHENKIGRPHNQAWANFFNQK